MILTLLSILVAAETCPPGTEYYFDQVVERDVKKGSWFYMYTSHLMRKKPLVIAVRSDAPIDIYSDESTKCPTGSTPVLMHHEGNNRIKRVHVPVTSDLGVVSIAVKGEEDAHFTLALENQHKKKKKRHPGIKLTFVFIAMCATVYVYFVNCVLPPKKEHSD